jgi:hypothetical protein
MPPFFVLEEARGRRKTRAKRNPQSRWKSSDPKMPHGISFRRGDDL